jgi:hypothetical protein
MIQSGPGVAANAPIAPWGDYTCAFRIAVGKVRQEVVYR